MDTIETRAEWDAIIRNGKQAAAQSLQKGDYAAGRSLALKVLAAAPSDPEALLLLAQSDSVAGNIAVARVLLSRAMALVPNAEVLRYQRNQLDQLDDQAAAEPYVQDYLHARAMFMDYPTSIQLETVGRCNANCTFCPHETLDRKFDEMSDKLFAKIVAEAATFPVTNPLNFYLNVINEPFMDKKIFERVRLINRSIPHAILGFFTNLNVLPRNLFEEMRSVRHLASLNVSFNAANQAEYESSMRIDFKRTVANLRRFMAENRQRDLLKAPIVLSRIATLDERDAAFVPQCRQLFPEFTPGVDYVPVVRNRANWLGQLTGKQAPVPLHLPCHQWLSISVFCDGTVPHCCMDAKGEHALGNLNERSLLEIYNSPKFRVLREAAIGRGAVHPCNGCSLV